MSLSWHKDLPVWDANKQRIIGEAKPGIFDTRFSKVKEGAPIPCMWYRVEKDGKTVGYGWIDVVWGDAEILLAVDPSSRNQGAGSFILEQLDDEARTMGLSYIYNIVRPTHPEAEKVTKWLGERGFVQERDGRLLRRVGQPVKS